MELVTDRLLLRELVLTDATACNVYESDPEVVRYQSHGVRTLDESRDYIARVRAESDVSPRRLFDLAVIERATDALIGRIGLCVRAPEAREAMLWYVLRRDRWGHGLIVEAARALLDFGFGELDLHRVYVDVDARNGSSLRVAEKLGMRREAHFVENAWVKGEWTDSVICALLAREWRPHLQPLAPGLGRRIDGAHLALVTVVVHEYDPAIHFFVDALGFELAEDSPSKTDDGRPKRWVVVRPPGAETGILLARAEGDAQTAVVGRQCAGRVGLFLRVDDFDAAHARMIAAGVEFVTTPRDEPYGRVAVFVDIAGNRWDLLGPS